MSHQVSHSAKDIFDLTSSPEDSPRLHTPVRVHQSSKYLQRNHLCRNILLFLRVKNFKMQVSNFFYFACDQSWGECHYTNAVLLSNKGSATRGGKLWTAKNTDLKIMDCPALQPYSSFFLFFKISYCSFYLRSSRASCVIFKGTVTILTLTEVLTLSVAS